MGLSGPETDQMIERTTALGMLRLFSTISLKTPTTARAQVNGRLRKDAFREKADGKNDSPEFFCQKLF
jgi:hypothetical protein